MKKMKKIFSFLAVGFISSNSILAQTESDGIRMERNNFCAGFTASYSFWDHYWEGTFKRTNENMGTVSSSSLAIMGNYGLSKHFNLILSVPYIKTKTSQGTLTGMEGLQDISAFIKYLALEKQIGTGSISLYGVLGGSMPSHNYIADFLPLSIGLKSKTANFRIIADYQIKNWFATASANYIYRYNIKIERTSYYTDKLIYSNEVFMPNVFSSKFGIGYRKSDLILEGIVDTWKTLGGFDIRKNDSPFPSNKMIMTRAGINIKIPIKPINGLSLIANSFYTLNGRNVGQALANTIGIFYVFKFKNGKEDSSIQQTH
jgi:hypothetical protein